MLLFCVWGCQSHSMQGSTHVGPDQIKTKYLSQTIKAYISMLAKLSWKIRGEQIWSQEIRKDDHGHSQQIKFNSFTGSCWGKRKKMFCIKLCMYICKTCESGIHSHPIYRLCLEKLYIFVSNIMKKILKAGSQRLLNKKGYFIGYHNHFKWFNLMARFKSYAYFYEGRWKEPGPILQTLRKQLSVFT